MDKRKTIILIIILLGGIISSLIFIPKAKQIEKNDDAILFKKEYEKYNNKTNANGKNYLNIDIDKNNIIKYSSLKEIKKIISSGTGVIYLGFPECPWCRNMLPILLESADSTSLESIYYLNMLELRDTIEYKNGNLITTKQAAVGYYEVVDLLSDILNEYTVKDDVGNIINTGKKRIYVPLVLFINNGKIVGYHANTVDSQNDPYIKLNDDQTNELYNIYLNNIHKVLNDICDDGC